VKVAVPWVASVTLAGFGVGPLLFGAAAQLLFAPKLFEASAIKILKASVRDLIERDIMMRNGSAHLVIRSFV